MFRRILISGLLAGVFCLGIVSAQEMAGDQPKQEFSPEYQQMYDQAIRLFSANDYAGALKQLDAAEKLQPGVIATQNLRGAIYVRQKNFEEAQKTFADLCRKDPENMMALFNLGETYFLQKNYSKAIGYFQTFAEKSKTQNSLGVYKAFLCNLQTGNEAAVKKTLDEVQPDVADPLHYYLNSAYLFKQNKPDEARGYLASAFQIYPGQANAAYIDSLIELGYVSPDDINASGGGSAPVVSGSASSQGAASATTASPDVSGLDGLLPSLEDKGKKK